MSWDFVEKISDPWVWLMAGALMGALELLIPASIFLWLGASAVVTGFIVMLLPPFSWQLQLGLFAVLAVAATVAGRALFSRSEPDSDQPALNSRGKQFSGRTVTLTHPIVNGVGRAEIDNTRWRVIGEDTPSGTVMKVTGIDGASLVVVRHDGGH